MSSHYVAASLFAAFLVALGCNTKPPGQVKPPTIEDPGGEDMAVQESTKLEPEVKMADEMTPAEKKAACCKQCAEGLKKDRTGHKPETIPCADFTSVLEEWCLEFFRDKPMKASECN